MGCHGMSWDMMVWDMMGYDVMLPYRVSSHLHACLSLPLCRYVLHAEQLPPVCTTSSRHVAVCDRLCASAAAGTTRQHITRDHHGTTGVGRAEAVAVVFVLCLCVWCVSECVSASLRVVRLLFLLACAYFRHSCLIFHTSV